MTGSFDLDRHHRHQDRVVTSMVALVCGVGFVLPLGFRRRWPLGSLLVAWSFCALGSLTTASFCGHARPRCARSSSTRRTRSVAKVITGT